MVKLLPDFSRRALGVGANLLLIFAVLCCMGRQARCEEEALVLPAYDLGLVDSTQMEIGEIISFTIKGFPEGDAPVISVSEAPEQDQFEYIQGGQVSDRSVFGVIPLKSGDYPIPSLTIKDKAGRSIGQTNPFELKIAEPAPPKDQNAAPPIPPVGLGFPKWFALTLAALMLIVVGAVFFLMHVLSKRIPKNVVSIPKAPLLPEDVVALDGLKKLQESGAIERGQFKLVYFGVSEIIKMYLGRRYQVEALEATSRELILMLGTIQGIEHLRVEQLKQLFEKLDLVKFTDSTPSPMDAKGILIDAVSLVEQTKRKVMTGAASAV